MFVVWWLVGGIENAREMLFVISVLASAMAGNVLMATLMKKAHKHDIRQMNKSEP